MPTHPRNLSPRQQAAAAAAPATVELPALRLSAATLTRTGLLHVRHGSACEDVATWRVPFPDSADASTAHAPFPGSSSSSSSSSSRPPISRQLQGSSNSSSGPAGLFCVFDGHGGGACSAQARTTMPAAIAAEFAGLDPILAPDAADAAEAGRRDTWERAYLAGDAILSCDEGCTSTTVSR
jgi:hypothetical protein